MKKYFFILSIMNLLDGALTFFGLINEVITESNPLMDYLWDKHPLLFIGTKILLSISLLLVGLKFKTDSSKKLLWHTLLLIPTIIYLYIMGLHVYWLFLYL